MMNNIDAALSMVGLATKAGRTVNGSEMCENAIKKQKVFLLLTATDASPKTIGPILKLCAHHQVPVRNIADREMLGKFSGKDNRAAVAIIDKGFAARIIEILDGTKEADGQLSARRAAEKTHGITEHRP
ncbi:MAG: L7Ae/L30e/S12e/Gadd45 family ribosomal protein [Saccharofermentanales bacterium]